APWVDAFGDPLPRGAVARLGTMRFRHLGCHAFAFSPSGDTLVSIGADAVQVWDAKTGRVIRSFPVENSFSGKQLSLPVARDVVVAVKADRLVVHDSKTGKELWRLDGERVRFESVAVAPDGSAVAVGFGEGEIRLYEAKTGKRLH